MNLLKSLLKALVAVAVKVGIKKAEAVVPTVEDAIASFTAALEKLKATAQHHEEETRRKVAEANAAMDAAAASQTERDRAVEIARKIGEIVG